MRLYLMSTPERDPHVTAMEFSQFSHKYSTTELNTTLCKWDSYLDMLRGLHCIQLDTHFLIRLEYDAIYNLNNPLRFWSW